MQTRHVSDDDDDDSSFFESFDRIPSSVSFDLGGASSSSDAEDDARISFASAIASPREFCSLSSFSSTEDVVVEHDYSLWMAEPISIEERRKRLLQGMGLDSNRKSGYTGSFRIKNSDLVVESEAKVVPDSTTVLLRSKSDAEAMTVGRREELFGEEASPSRALIRATSAPSAFLMDPESNSGSCDDMPDGSNQRKPSSKGTDEISSLKKKKGSSTSGSISRRLTSKLHSRISEAVAFYTIKNLDTGKEFLINLENGTWNSRLSDIQTGVQLTMDEFERSVGHCPIVQELMRREFISPGNSNGHLYPNGSIITAAVKGMTKKRGVNWLKNIRGVANSVTGLMLERDRSSLADKLSGRTNSTTSNSSDWMKVHRRGKPFKELSGLYMSQEINAHQGSIWCMRFSTDALYMASAGEDRIIHVWQVLECDSVSSCKRPLEDRNSTKQPPVGGSSPDGYVGPDGKQTPVLKRGKTMSSKRKNSIPEYVVVPETIFSLSEKPYCSFQGHLDDVLDLSWSKSQYLLSSSMDKTVRLWDMETKACLKLFAHNDYVTCIQFNPVDDRYFISGSLDAKVRIWSIPDRQVVDWNDLHEMVTAACYTPDGQCALVGSHKGSCRFYTMSGCKLQQKSQLDLHNKKKKSQAKKITGFQFSPGKQSELLVTSADSQIRVFDGVELIHKFRGFRNTSSQISATFTPDSNYVVCASEDSNVYVWKRDENCNVNASGRGKTWVTTHSHENFHCKDVSVAIPWPGSSKYEPPSAYPSCRFNPGQTTPPECSVPSSSIVSNSEDPFCSSGSHCNPTSKKRSPSIASIAEDPFHSTRSQCQSTSKKGSASAISSPEDSFACSRNSCPIPKKGPSDRPPSCTEDELSNPSRVTSGISSSTSSGSSSWLRSGPLSSISGFSLPSSGLSTRWYTGGNSKNSVAPAATAWGLVVVTAGLGGEIKVFQNFGLPLRLSR